jgi:Phage derived protein Gp49-like (DUF891).
MDWEIAYYSDAVQETIGAWPAGIRAYYARLTERMCMFVKKSPKTPQRELEVARRRLADMQRQREGDRDEDPR